MSAPDPQHRAEPDSDASIDQIEADIARTREELGETVEQLTSSLNVKAQAKQQVDQAKDRARQQVEDVKDRALGGLSAARDAVTGHSGTGTSGGGSAGWIGASALGAGVALGLYLIVRAVRR